VIGFFPLCVSFAVVVAVVHARLFVFDDVSANFLAFAYLLASA
jgi:hypothetical protein